MTTETTLVDDARPFNGEALLGRLFEQTIGAFELFNVYIGERLGLSRALAADGHVCRSRPASRDRSPLRTGVA